LAGIATLGTTNMSNIVPPPASKYKIYGDHDAAGIRAAESLAHRLVREGYSASIAIPPQPDSDWNDFLMQKRGL
jgi:hypothetical protein